jgi:hypothetical protein
LHEFEEIKISRQWLRGGKLLRLLSGFRTRIRPLSKFYQVCTVQIPQIFTRVGVVECTKSYI